MVKKSDEKMLQSFEICMWRRVLRITWAEAKMKVRNEDGIVKKIDSRDSRFHIPSHDFTG